MQHAATISDERRDWASALAGALLIHALLAIAIYLSDINWQQPRRPQATGLDIAARLVDAEQVASRLEAVRERQRQQQREQEAAALRARREAERQRALEEQRAREQAERERREAEQRRAREQAEREARLEAERQRELERRRQEELERRRRELEELRRREREQQARRDEELQKQLEELRRQREQISQQSELTERQLQALQRQAEQPVPPPAGEQQARPPAAGNGVQGDLRDQYISAIAAAVRAAWIRPPTALAEIECRVAVLQIPGGEVIDASILRPCNADAATRRSIIAAVKRHDLPYRGFEEVFQREIIFTFKDE